MEEILLQHLGLTKEEFDKGLQDFFISKSKNNTSKDGTFILDTMLNNGIPKGGITALTGTSNYGSIYNFLQQKNDYILHLISNYKIENRNKKLNDLGI
jgi:hypothetical protein